MKYAKSGDVNVAWVELGEGPIDLVYIPGFVSHVDVFLRQPLIGNHMRRLAAFSRVILFDKRGVGMSDPWSQPPTLDERMDDIRAVMDAAGSERAAIFAVSEGGPMALSFAATYPERVSALALYATGARFTQTDDYPHGYPREFVAPFLDLLEETWGESGAVSVEMIAPSLKDDVAFREEWGRARKIAASPRMAADTLRMNADIDVRHVLPAVQAPALVMHRTGDQFVPVENGRYLGEHLPGARYVEFDGADHLPFVNDDEIVGLVEEFLTGSRTEVVPDRALATVLFTDIVGSTERAAAEGDAAWRALLDRHDTTTRAEVERFGGRAIKSTGDGFLATFDRPGRAIEAARSVVAAVGQGGLQIRAGLHTGEIELRGDDVGGIAVHIGARVGALAGPGEVLVSSTVRDLVVGSPFTFDDRGTYQLKGVPGEWRLLAVN